MLKKLLIGLFLLGMLCGAGSISAGGMFFGAGAGPDGDSTSTPPPRAKSIVCGGGC